jgi:hypothetical protein
MPRQRRPGHATLQVNVRTLNRYASPDPTRMDFVERNVSRRSGGGLGANRR